MLSTVAALALLAGAAQAAAGAGPRITLAEGVFQVRPAAASGTLEVFVDGPPAPPPLLGRQSRDGDTLSFEPRFPLQPGLRYRAVYRAAGSAAPLVLSFAIPRATQAAASVLEHVYPSAELLPENLLKLYLHFSAPMSRGEAYARIRLLDEAGRAVELAFLEIDQELWDHAGRRLTILFDPGRVKRELLPNEEAGSPLREGRRYTLVVERGWPDAAGNPLAAEARKTFRVGPPDHDSPRLRDWRITPPRSGTRDALLVAFPEPLDRGLLERVLLVLDAGGTPLAGEVEVREQETRWLFTPRAPWRKGDHSLRVDTILEDLAGNSIGRPFEVDVFEKVEDRALAVTESLKFRIE
jgi:hypothetical protein